MRYLKTTDSFSSIYKDARKSVDIDFDKVYNSLVVRALVSYIIQYICSCVVNTSL